jgi:hypothetical protein
LKVKTADRLANVRNCIITSNDGLLKMYKKEHAAFKEAVYRPGICESGMVLGKIWTTDCLEKPTTPPTADEVKDMVRMR